MTDTEKLAQLIKDLRVTAIPYNYTLDPPDFSGCKCKRCLRGIDAGKVQMARNILRMLGEKFEVEPDPDA